MVLDVTNLRTKQQDADIYMAVLQPQILLSAKAYVAPGTSVGIRTITYTTGTGTAAQFACIESGQTVEIDTSKGTKRVRLKSIAGDEVLGQITVDENAIVWEDLAAVRILHNYEIWPVPPSIREQVFYKYYDVVYSDQNTKPNPVAITQGHLVKEIQTGSPSVRIPNGVSDGYYRSTTFTPTGTYVLLGYLLNNCYDWFRFTNVQIPLGATITSAKITLTSSSNNASPFDLNINGEKAVNPPYPISIADYNSRVQTAAVVNWPSSTAWITDTTYDTPDLSAIVTEIIGLPGWASGNAMQFFVSLNAGTGLRQAYSYESDATKSALLTITYSFPAVFDIDLSNSYAVTDGATISSYAHSCVKNGSGTTGITIANAAVATTTLTITQAGQYWLKQTVTDSNGKPQNTFRAVFVYDQITKPYKDFSVSSLTGDWSTGGYSLSVNTTGGVTLADFPDKTLCLLWYKNRFDGTESYINLWDCGDNILFAGYLRYDSDTDSFEDGSWSTTFNLTTANDLIDQMTEFGTIEIETNSSPTTWAQYATWLTIGRGVHHLLKWHSTVLETCDVWGLLDNVLGVKNCSFTEPTILQMANTLAMTRGIFSKLVCNRIGQFYFVTDSQMLNDTDRALLPTIFTIQEADVSGTVTVVRSPEENTGAVDLNGFSYVGATNTSTAILAIAPGYRDSFDLESYAFPEFRGASNTSIPSQVLASQTDANEKVGRALAKSNLNPRELRVANPANYLGAFDIVPSRGWYVWGIDDTDLQRQTELKNTNLLCRNISVLFGSSTGSFDGTIQTSVVLEIEAQGPDGIQGNYQGSLQVIAYPNGSDTTENTPTTDDNIIIPAATSEFIGVFDNVTDGKIYTFYGTVNGVVITVNTPVEVDTGTGGAVSAISATQAICAYTVGTDFYARLLTISGTSVTVGAAKAIDGNFTITALSSTLAVVIYGDSGTLYAQALGISGSTITVGVAAVIDTELVSNSFGIEASIDRLSATKAIVCYSIDDGANPYQILGSVITVSGTTITANAPVSISADVSLNSIWVSVTTMSASSAICFYRKGNPNLEARALTGITTTFNVGAETELSTTIDFTGDTIGPKSSDKIGINQAERLFTKGNTYEMMGVMVSLSGAVVSVDSTTQYSTDATDNVERYMTCRTMKSYKTLSATTLTGNYASLISAAIAGGTIVSDDNYEPMTSDGKKSDISKLQAI